MGGLNSGRWLYFGARRTVESCSGIDVRAWSRHGYLVHGRNFQWNWMRRGKVVGGIGVLVDCTNVLLYYRVNGDDEKQYSPQRVSLSSSNCTYGGKRPWFICPSKGCERRVAWLYFSGRFFACRHCLRLTYGVRNRPKWDRVTDAAERVRKKLKWAPGILNDEGPKPKWMRWKTFYRLAEQESQLRLQALQAAAAHFTR